MNTAALVSAALDLRRAQRRHAPSGEVLMLHTAFEEAADAGMFANVEVIE